MALRVLLVLAMLWGLSESCDPASITDTDNAGCGRWLPRFHPKNAVPLAHNNDANAPFEYNGVHHLFMQATFPGSPSYNGFGIGLAHLRSTDLAHWTVEKPALVPGAWGGPIGGVGRPAGNATEGYYSGSATMVNGVPRIIIPAVFFDEAMRHTCPIKCADPDSWHCMLNGEWRQRCAMVYTLSMPANLSDNRLADWTEPVTIVDGRYDGVQPHSPSFDDTTHAWIDDEDADRGTWRYVIIAGPINIIVISSSSIY